MIKAKFCVTTSKTPRCKAEKVKLKGFLYLFTFLYETFVRLLAVTILGGARSVNKKQFDVRRQRVEYTPLLKC